MKFIFRDNFFSAGQTEIMNESQELVGKLDLQSAFNSSVDVYDQMGNLQCTGSFPFFSSKWEVCDANGSQLGYLKYRMALFSKKYEYVTEGRGSFLITSPAFSYEYEIYKDEDELIARFTKVSGWFSAGAYCLDNDSDLLNHYELVTVIMGMHAIQKRHRSAATN